jgi:hypothetical protein
MLEDSFASSYRKPIIREPPGFNVIGCRRLEDAIVLSPEKRDKSMRSNDHLYEQYTDDDWRAMQTAHDRASQILGRSPKTDIHSDRLGRTVIALFNLKIRSIEQIVERAVQSERSFEKLESMTESSNSSSRTLL